MSYPTVQLLRNQATYKLWFIMESLGINIFYLNQWSRIFQLPCLVVVNVKQWYAASWGGLIATNLNLSTLYFMKEYKIVKKYLLYMNIHHFTSAQTNISWYVPIQWYFFFIQKVAAIVTESARKILIHSTEEDHKPAAYALLLLWAAEAPLPSCPRNLPGLWLQLVKVK